MVRRMLVRATTKAYNKVIPQIINELRSSNRGRAGDFIETFLADQKGDSQYLPDDEEVRDSLRDLPIYRRLSRARLRMVLEAVEDHTRGWKNGKSGLGGERVARGKYAIEHIMPRKWASHWPAPDDPREEADRERLIHTIGNLTLLTGPLNSKVSNGAWAGPDGKWQALEAHDVLLLNNDLRKRAPASWTHEAIRARGEEIAQIITEIWSVPQGHRSGFSHKKSRPRQKVGLDDLLAAGVLEPGMTLFCKRKKYAGRVATLLGDGQIDVDGTTYARPSQAAAAISGKRTGGKSFFLVDQASRRSLRDVWHDYVDSLADGVDEDENDDDGEDDDS